MASATRHPYEAGATLPGSPYVLGTVLGVGGTAAVYEAEDQTCGRRVVIKIVRPDVSRRGAFTAEQMQREARTLVALHAETEHVVDVITAGVTDDAERLPYYVMEQLTGRTLRSALDGRIHEGVPTGLDEAISVGIDLGVALDHAHRMGIIHLDVKPENAFVHQRRDGSLIMKLLDFGISSMLGVTLGGFRGTYRYAAPEQIRGERVSAATDIYSLGLVLYEALTLEQPFKLRGEHLSPAALAYAHCSRAPAPLSPLRPDAPEALVTLVMQCLAKRVEERPASAAFLTGRLREIKERLATEPQQPGDRSYLETLTSVVSAISATPAREAEALPASMAAPPPASELFVTAAVLAAPLVPPAPPTLTRLPAPLAFPAAPVNRGNDSTAPRSARPSRVPAIVGAVVGLVIASGVAVALVRGAGRASSATLGAPPPSSDSLSRSPASTSHPEAPASSSVLPSASSASAPTSPPAIAPSASQPPLARPTPHDAPRPQAHPAPPVVSATPVASPASVAPPASPPAPRSSSPQGITTQKEWF